MTLLINKFIRSNRPLFLNINIQSLNSKYEKLKNCILSLTNNNIQIDLIALQETWSIKHPQLLDIPGFQQLVYKNRSRGRGGGVGFYIRNGLTYSVNNELSVFVDKVVESLTLDITFIHNNAMKQCTVTNIYSTGHPQLQRVNLQMNKLTIFTKNLKIYSLNLAIIRVMPMCSWTQI